MAHVLDLSMIQQPTLDLTMNFPERRTIRVTVPTTDLVQEFMTLNEQQTALLASGNKEGVIAAYDIMARLLSCNMDGISITGEELLSVYKINMFTLLAIMKAYKAFIDDIEKN